jgi:hypothetical protein
VALRALWHGSFLEVSARVVPRYLWTTVSIDVSLDGEPVLCTGGQASALGASRVTFLHNETSHEAELSWGKFSQGAFPFILRVDGEVVLASEVPVENWAVVRLCWGIANVLIVAVFVLFVWLVWQWL